jgi:N-acylneuraminate cytidylyltransferase
MEKEDLTEGKAARRQEPMTKNLCIIPARGGSKRIPRKNIKDFLGKPIIGYSIEAAINSGLFDKVMVSTDDEEIANVAISQGASIPFMRSKENSNDFATTLDVVKEVLATYKKLGEAFENVCVIYPTAPFIEIEKLKEGYDKLKTANAAISVTEFSYPIWRSFKLKLGEVTYQWPEYEKSRSQDLQNLFHDAGQWYWIITNCIKDSLVAQKTAAVILSNLEVQDIDTLEDWRIAEMKYEYLQSIK